MTTLKFLKLRRFFEVSLSTLFLSCKHFKHKLIQIFLSNLTNFFKEDFLKCMYILYINILSDRFVIQYDDKNIERLLSKF